MQEPIKITPHFYQLGTRQFPAYLSIGDVAMIIEGGTGATTGIIMKQIEQIGLDPQKIKYIALTHTHADHIGAIPRLKKIWPQIKVVGSKKAAKILKDDGMLKEFLWIDKNIAGLLKKKREIEELPQQLDNYDFSVDIIVKEGDKIDLGSDIVWHVYETPGHSPCHLAYFEKGEGSLVIGDATGFYVPEKDVFWPNYFDSLTAYINSIKKLSHLNAKRGVLSHNCVIEEDLSKYFGRAIEATLAYHREMLKRVKNGENGDDIAVDKANWVNSITDIQPYKVMLNLSKLLIKRSHEAEKVK